MGLSREKLRDRVEAEEQVSTGKALREARIKIRAALDLLQGPFPKVEEAKETLSSALSE